MINEKIDSLVKEARDEAGEKDGAPTDHRGFYVELDVDLSYASPRMVSVNVVSSNYLGQAHPYSESNNINFDRIANRERAFSDLIDADAANQLFDFCRSQIVKQKIDRAGGSDDGRKDDVGLEEVAEGTKDLSNWQFESSAVDIYYGAYAFGGYGQCMCIAQFPIPGFVPS